MTVVSHLLTFCIRGSGLYYHLSESAQVVFKKIIEANDDFGKEVVVGLCMESMPNSEET
jgi:hypothetical protein